MIVVMVNLESTEKIVSKIHIQQRKCSNETMPLESDEDYASFLSHVT